MLTKEILQESKTCRLCGITDEESNTINDSNNKDRAKVCLNKTNLSFIPIYEKHPLAKGSSKFSNEGTSTSTNVSKMAETGKAEEDKEDSFDQLINRYLPLKIYETDAYFPRFLCTDCIKSLYDSKTFFDKIIEGQRLLMKIINQATVVLTQQSKKPKTIYTDDNSILVQNIPKRRGRPRKSEQKVNSSTSEKSAENNTADAIQVSTTKLSKRTNRPPKRYMMSEITADKEVELEQLEGEAADDDGSNSKQDGTTTGKLPSKSDNLTRCSDKAALSESQETLPDHLSIDKENIKIPSDTDTAKRRHRGRINKDIDYKIKQRPTSRRIKPKKGVAKYNCSDCSKSFFNYNSLKYHKTVSHQNPNEQKKFTCSICDKSFLHPALLKCHLFTHSTEKSFQCPSCPLKFRTRSALSTHKTTKHVKLNLCCETCGDKFSKKSDYNNHLRIHTTNTSEERPFSCEFCQKGFNWKCNLDEHRRIHTKERPFKCPEDNCGKCFTAHSQLKAHIRTHTGVKLYYCDICGKGMAHSTSFKIHLKRHYNQRDMECKTCGKAFIDGWALKKHNERVHTTERKYMCDICKKTFNDPNNLTKHKKIHKNDEPVLLDGQEEVSPRISFNKSTSHESNQQGNIRTEPELESQYILQDTFNSLQQIHLAVDRDQLRQETGIEGLSELGTNAFVILPPDNNGDGESNEEQFIYICPENLPVFTVTLDENQALELHGSEGVMQMLSGSEQIAFAAIDNTDEATGTHYLSLQVNSMESRQLLQASPTGSNRIEFQSETDSQN